MIFGFIFLGLVIVLGLYIAGVYNKLIGLRNNVSNKKADIEVELKRRFDLIPNLVETVKGYAKHESETLKEVVDARNVFQNAGTTGEKLEASANLTGALSRLMVTVEQYPDLKANASFVSLQEELAETENKISVTRKYYNDVVLNYNNVIKVFPSNIVANMFNFNEEKFFETKEGEQENPKVSF